jgi:omega-6 fatty acid desaturase (delta-12 desaturase)
VTVAQLDAVIRPFQAPSRRSSIEQLFSSIGGFIASVAAIYTLVVLVSPLCLLLVPVAAGFLVRIFIIQHDCGHGAFFRSKRANDIVGFVCSLMTLAPYASWRRQHAGHHGVWNDLDRRDRGVDIYSTCLTVTEYALLSRRAKLWHRVSRHPIVTHLLLPPVIFFLLYRLPFDMPKSWKRERRALILTNLSLAGLYGGLGFLLGFHSMIAVGVPIMVVASITGVWLFGVQHRFEGALWARHADWNAIDASLGGSSYLRLPRILQWFTGNIGFHHLHHLNPRVPNYRLQDCHETIMPLLHQVQALTLWKALRAPSFMLWDEDRRAMVPIPQAT